MSEDRARDASESDAMTDDVDAFMQTESGGAAADGSDTAQHAPGLMRLCLFRMNMFIALFLCFYS